MDDKKTPLHVLIPSSLKAWIEETKASTGRTAAQITIEALERLRKGKR